MDSDNTLVKGPLVHSKRCLHHRNSRGLPDSIVNELATLEPEAQDAAKQVWKLFCESRSTVRQVMLKGLLSYSCSAELSVLSDSLKELARIDFITALPPEISFKVLTYLDSASLCRAAQVSRQWRDLADDDVVWHRMCEQHIEKKCTKCGWGLPLLERRRLKSSRPDLQKAVQKKRKFDPDWAEEDKDTPQPGAVVETARSETPACKTRPWKDVYLERYKVEHNWRTGKYQLVEFDTNLPGAARVGLLSVQFDDLYVVTGSTNGSVRVWDIETGKLVRELKGHVRGVNSIKFDKKKIVTGSSDHTVRIWNYENGENISTFTYHDKEVLAVDFDGKLIASGSADLKIKVLNFETMSCFTLRGHTDWVHSVKVYSETKKLYSASEDTTVRMWDIDSQQCVRVFGGPGVPASHMCQVQYVQPLFLDHLDEQDKEYHHGEDKEYHHGEDSDATDTDAVGHRTRSKPKCRQPTHLLTCSLDHTIKLWDTRTGECVRTLFGHIDGVWTVRADTFRIVSGSHDNTVKVWDLQSGVCLQTLTDHKGAIMTVDMSDSRVVSAGDDGIVRMYCYD